MGDAERGKKIFIQRCAQCHTVKQGGKNKNGPNLFEIYNRESGTNPTYAYSDAMKNAHITWDDSTLDEYLINPNAYIPGIRTDFAGMMSKTDRTNVLEYLKTLK